MARPSNVPAQAPPLRGAADRSTVALLFASLRPGQWTKNLFVFAGLLFGGRLLEPEAILLASATFVIFCALSGALYLFNDLADRHAGGAPVPTPELDVRSGPSKSLDDT